MDITLPYIRFNIDSKIFSSYQTLLIEVVEFKI
jgi:hypothetical protein